MRLLDLFVVASMPVLKVLMLILLGLFLALSRVNILKENTKKELNQVVFFVLNPALQVSNLAKTITNKSIVLLWFMPVNLLCTFIIGSALGWILIKITRPAKHLKGLILGCCAAGNLGYLPLIIIPALCKEKGNPFGNPDVCYNNGIAYASLSLALGAIYIWSYIYNIMRICSTEANKEVDSEDSEDSTSNAKAAEGMPELIQGIDEEALPLSKQCPISDEYEPLLPLTKSEGVVKISFFDKIMQRVIMISSKLNLKEVFAPSTIGAIVGFIIGLVPQIRNLLIGARAPLHVVEDSASLLGQAAIPTVILIVGGNLLKGLTGSSIRPSLVIGILSVRYILLPLSGIVIVKGAIRFGLVHSDPLYQFVLLLQFALPPAMNIGTITQLFGVGQSESSVVLMWAYALASVSLTVWSTIFMWLVS